MAKKDQYTAEQMIEALRYTRGMITLAADRVGCTYTTIRRYIDKYPTVKAVYDEVRERTLDNVELRLINAVNRDDLTAIIFYLKTQGKRRGYVERTEHMVFDSAQMKRFEELASKLGKSLPELFEDMVNVLGAELSADVETGSEDAQRASPAQS